MDTENFLDVVLPEAGRRCVGVLAKGQFTNYFGTSNHWAADAIRRIDASASETYFGCASYDNSGGRKADNVVAVRSFWVDIDTQEGKPKEKYADRKEALKQLLAFCSELGLSKPFVVSSGYGIHAYWPCDEDMTPVAWKKTATLLKKATKAWGLAADPTRTADEASVLRPVGAHNYKRGNSKEVKLVMSGDVTTHAEFHLRVEEYLGVDAMPNGNNDATNLNADLAGPPPQFAPSNAELVAEHCAVIREMRDTLGDIDQPTWYGSIGVLAFTEQGADICHEWSKGYSGYSKRETQAKFEQASKYAPTTCEKLSECRPDACAACPHFGRIRSPISLGTPYGAPQTVPVSMLPDEFANTPSGPFIPEFPRGFGYGPCGQGNKDNGMFWIRSYEAEDDDGNKVWLTENIRFCDVLFFPITRIRSPQDTYSMNIFMRDNTGASREFIIDHGAIAEGGKTLISELGSREVNIHPKSKVDVGAYLTAWIGKLRDEYAETPSVEQYGWHDGKFVVGNTLITPQEVRKSILIKSASSMSKYLEPKGSLEDWVLAMDKAYNYPGQEALQFCVLASFAAPLIHMVLDTGGVFVHAYSAKSGFGKTTAQFAGLSAWGKPSDLSLREGAMSTINAMYNHFGVMNNLPIVVDEMTNCSNAFASDVVYNTSAGTGKRRMNADGSTRDTLNWSTIVSGSSNALIAEKLAMNSSQSEAEMLRVWEFEVSCVSKHPTHVANALFATFKKNYGHAGRVYAKYLVENYDLVQNTVLQMRDKFDRKANIRQAERYWSALHACVLTALGICRKLNLLHFDPAALTAWILKEIANNRDTVSQSVSEPLEMFGEMLADVFNNVLVTIGEGNMAHGSEATILRHPKGQTITGRSILPTSTSAEKLFISAGVAKEWCNERRVSFREVHNALVAAGWADKSIKRMSLGKGTKEYSGLGGPVKVIELNPSAVRAAMGDTAVAQKITAVISGGLDSDAATGTD